MATPNYAEKINDLRKRVGQHATIINKNEGIVDKVVLNFSKINTGSPIFYIIPPILIIILLFFIKPSFITMDNIDKDNNITKKIKFKQLLIYSLIGGAIIDIGIWAYFRKKEK